MRGRLRPRSTIGSADVRLSRNCVVASSPNILLCLTSCGCLRRALPAARGFFQRFPQATELTAKALIRILERHGSCLDHSAGSHRLDDHAARGRWVTVPFQHGDVPVGTLLAILKASGLSRDE